MLLRHIFGLLTHPHAEWEAIRDENASIGRVLLGFLLLVAAIPPVAAYIGTTSVGWRIGIGEPVRLTSESALVMALGFYVAILVATLSVGALIHWMSVTYDARQSLARCLALAAFTATPLFLVGIIQLYPTLWLNFIVGLPALAYTVYLLFSGVPVMLDIPSERAFLMSNGILTVGLVILVGLLALTAGLWGMGIGPRFVDS